MKNALLKITGWILAVLFMVVGMGTGLMLPVFTALAMPGVFCVPIIKYCIRCNYPWTTVAVAWVIIGLYLWPREAKHWQIRMAKFNGWCERQVKKKTPIITTTKPYNKLQLEINRATRVLDHQVSKWLGLRPRE